MTYTPTPADLPVSPASGLSRITGHPSNQMPALDWLDLGFAVHPLVEITDSRPKRWRPEFRLLTLAQRRASVNENPALWKRVGVEPGSLHSLRNFIVIDDDSYKPEFDGKLRETAEYCLELAAPKATRHLIPQETTPHGGRHYYFLNPDNIDIANKNLGPLDIICASNVACDCTEGYEFLVPFPEDLGSVPALSRATYDEIVKLLKPIETGSKNDPMAIRIQGRNNYARNLCWRSCMAGQRAHKNKDDAKEFAHTLWLEQVKQMSITLGGESPSEWQVNPETDFTRTWEKAVIDFKRQDDLGMMLDNDGMLTAKGRWERNEDFCDIPIIDLPISSVWNSTIYAGKPLNGGVAGVQVQMFDGRSFFLADTSTTVNQVQHDLGGVMFKDVPHAAYTKAGYKSHQAVKVGLQASVSGESYSMPTGIWWRHEFPNNVQTRLPPGPWAFYGTGVIDPKTGELDESTPVTPITGEQVFANTGQPGHVPWTLGPASNTPECAAFLRTAAGFQQPHVSAQACALAALGLIRGWLRGSTVVGRSQPFVSIEGPAGSGKSHGIFAAMYGLAGAKTGLRSEAQFSIEMTQSRCAMLVLDDLDLGKEWATLMRLQQAEESWSKTNALRELLGLMVVSSQGFDLIDRDQALLDRVFRIFVPDVVKHRKSLLDPERSQADDLHSISVEAARKQQGRFTRLVVKACGMVDVDVAVKAIQPLWANHPYMAVRQKLIYVSAEISLRIYCWIARGANPGEQWWLPETDLSVVLDDGSEVDLVNELRNPSSEESHFDEAAKLRRGAAPLVLALQRYLTERGSVNIDEMDQRPEESWFRSTPVFIMKGTIRVKPAALARWAHNIRDWPEGVRRSLFTSGQLDSDLNDRNASKIQKNYGIAYRSLSIEETERFYHETLGWEQSGVHDEDDQLSL